MAAGRGARGARSMRRAACAPGLRGTEGLMGGWVGEWVRGSGCSSGACLEQTA